MEGCFDYRCKLGGLRLETISIICFLFSFIVALENISMGVKFPVLC
jgi:hypothetical protein